MIKSNLRKGLSLLVLLMGTTALAQSAEWVFRNRAPNDAGEIACSLDGVTGSWTSPATCGITGVSGPTGPTGPSGPSGPAGSGGTAGGGWSTAWAPDWSAQSTVTLSADGDAGFFLGANCVRFGTTYGSISIVNDAGIICAPNSSSNLPGNASYTFPGLACQISSMDAGFGFTYTSSMRQFDLIAAQNVGTNFDAFYLGWLMTSNPTTTSSAPGYAFEASQFNSGASPQRNLEGYSYNGTFPSGSALAAPAQNNGNVFEVLFGPTAGVWSWDLGMIGPWGSPYPDGGYSGGAWPPSSGSFPPESALTERNLAVFTSNPFVGFSFTAPAPTSYWWVFGCSQNASGHSLSVTLGASRVDLRP